MVEIVYVKHYGLSDKKVCPGCGLGVGGPVALYSLPTRGEGRFLCATCFMKPLEKSQYLTFVPLDHEGD